MHQLNLLSFVYKNIAMQYNAPNLGIGMAMAFTFKQAAKMLSDHLLMHEARKALHALQKVGSNTNTDALQRTGRGNRGGASHMQNIISSKGMTGYPMPGDASDSASESASERAENEIAKLNIDAFLHKNVASFDALERCRNFMRVDPVAVAMLIRDHSGQLARDLIGTGISTNDWIKKHNPRSKDGIELVKLPPHR